MGRRVTPGCWPGSPPPSPSRDRRSCGSSHRPLCAIVGVDSVNPGSQACPAVIPDATLTLRTAAVAIIAGVGLILVLLRFVAFDALRDEESDPRRMTAALRSLILTGAGALAALVAATVLLPETVLVSLTNVPVEPIAMVVAVPLAYLGLQILASRDGRRFVVGLVVATVGWFAILYPNISALPLPSNVVAAYQGILPTYLYAFQFPVSTVTRNANTPLFTPMLAILTIALVVTCLVVAYSAWVWRLALGRRRAGGQDIGRRRGPGPERWRLRDRRPEVLRQRAARREPADDEAVVVLDLGGDPRPAERLGSLAAGGAHLGPQVRIGQQPADRERQLLGLMGRDEQAFAATPDDALVAVDVRGDDRGAGGHRLEQDDPERLPAGGRRGEHVRGPEELRLLRVRDATQELDLLEATRRDISPGLAFLRPGPDDEQAVLEPGPAQDAVRLEQVEQALARLVATDEQHVRRAVLPAGQRDRPGEARDVDPVGDDLVVAREEPVDEMAGGGAHRDPAVEPRRMAAHDPAADLVRRGEAGIGVEGRDVHAVRLAEQEQRQERDERFVEVQDVEPLAGQQLADLADVARRERERPDRAIGRHAEADPDAQDVALGGPLRAVAGGDDPDVVAAQPQVLVEIADVLRDAARFRVDVRADEADLHGRPAWPISAGSSVGAGPPTS